MRVVFKKKKSLSLSQREGRENGQQGRGVGREAL